MSKDALDWVFEDSDLPGVDRMVMAVHARHANSEGVSAPSLRVLVAETGFGRSAVRDARIRLERAGLLCRLTTLSSNDTVSSRDTPFRLTIGSTMSSRDTVGGTIGGELRLQLGTDKAPKSNGYEEQLEPLFTFWKDALSLNGRTKFTKGRKTCLRARLREGYEPERIQRAILGCAGSEWHREHGQTDLTLICRNGEKLEQFEARPLPSKHLTESRRQWAEYAEGLKAKKA